MGNILLVILLLFPIKIKCWREYILIPEQLELRDIDSKVLTNASMYFYKFNQTSTAYFGGVRLLVPLDGKFETRVQVAQFHGTKYKDTSLLDITVDICNILNNGMGLGMVNDIVAAWMKNGGNLPKKCPIKPGFYYFTNATMNEEMFPPYLPGDRFRLQLSYLHNRKKIGKIILILNFDKRHKLRQTHGYL